MDPLFIAIDGNSLMHRAFHAIAALEDTHGNPINAVYGFTSMLLKILLERKPTHMAVAFDMHGPTFRHEAYESYKGTRKPTDEALRPQFPKIKELLTLMRIPIIEAPRYEADDILGTLAAQCEEKGLPALLVTGDRDALQLVTQQTHVLYTRRGISDTTEFDPETVKRTYGVTPQQVPDLKGLMGDASDNIPGIPGVGEKTALKLLDAYETLERVLAGAHEQKGKLKERLLAHRALAEQSLWLATIVRDAPLPFPVESCTLDGFSGATEAFEQLGFRSLQPRLSKIIQIFEGQAEKEENPETSAETSAASYGEPVHLVSPEAISAFLQSAKCYALHESAEHITLATANTWAIIPIQRDMASLGFEIDKIYALLAPLWRTAGSLRVFDAKRWLHMLDTFSLVFDGNCVCDDAMLAAWLLNPLQPVKTLETLEPAADARFLFTLCEQQRHALSQQGMLSLYQDMELPLMRVLLAMEREGFLVDKAVLDELGVKFTAMENELHAAIIEETGGIPFNVKSPKQLAEVLFERLGLPPGRKTKSGYSTDAETLEGLLDKHPVIHKLLEYRQVAKLNATYIEGLRQQIESDGRVRSSFDQTATVTGRISSNEPNLQNIPVRTPMGRDIRKAFIARDGYTLIDADYSQIELRILAHLSGDEAFINAFLAQEDIHKRTAADVYGVPLDEVTSDMRSAAKAVNFGIVYGISDFGLARNIGVSRREAGEFIERYFQKYPGIRRFMDKAVADGKALGYAQTLFGRRRPLPELVSSNYNTRSFGERAAMNTPVQGAAADIIKLAMIHVHQRLLKSGLSARLLLQVHDELMIECPLAACQDAAQLLRECMEQVVSLRVPLQVDIGIGHTWYEAK